jgi:adenylate cyclase
MNMSSFSIFQLPPEIPSRWTCSYVERSIKRTEARIQSLRDRLNGITEGRIMPTSDQVAIGSGRRFDVSVLFLDICSFSARPNWTEHEQKAILVLMNTFMAEMMNVVHDFGGTFEKNTGDGLMAYFGESAKTAADRVKPAIEAAVVMHYLNEEIISPWLREQCGIAPVRFRVGIDTGPVTIGHVGNRGRDTSLVAIGATANIACKLMGLIQQGGICIGHNVYSALPADWNTTCTPAGSSGFVYVATQQAYPAWILHHRLGQPYEK